MKKNKLIFSLRFCVTLLIISWVGITQAQQIRGTVTEESGNTLAGVSVDVTDQGGKQITSTSTDDKGNFSLQGLSREAAYKLRFTFVSYLPYELNDFRLKQGDSVLQIQMKPDNAQLDEVVVIGYGSVKKSDLSASVSTVPDIGTGKNRSVMDVPSMVQGKVAGVTVVSDGGHPNKTPRMMIRGTGSKSDEAPLVVVDGVPGAPYNPADVESITVLKDAASAAIYGAFSGASGVLLVTTKQAKEGKPSLSYDSFFGGKSAWRLPQSLTGEQEAEVYTRAYEAAGQTIPDGWLKEKNPDAFVTRTDWIDEIFRTALTHRHTVTINAGTEKFGSLVQGRYEKNEGTLINTFNENASLRFNGFYKLTDHLKFRQELFYNNNSKRGTGTESGYDGAIISAIYMPRSATPYYADGSFGGVGPVGSDYLGIYGDAINPVATLMRNNAYDKISDILSVSELSYSDIIPGLDVLSRFSYTQSNLFFKSFTPQRNEPGKPDGNNNLKYDSNRNNKWIWENTINYDRAFGRHRIGAMFSTTAQSQITRGVVVQASNFEREDDWAQYFINAGDFTKNRPEDSRVDDRNISYVGRLSYSWADRYFVTGSYRKDIAGRLPKGYKGKGFPGLTAAWKVSSEPFFEVPAINLLKFRASWGRIGNLSSIPENYAYQTLSSKNLYQIGDGAPLSTSWYIGSLFNPQLSWETSEQTDFGLDLEMLNNRLSVTADYFKKKTFDLIQDQVTNWPNTYGLSGPKINQGEISNEGFELAVNWQDKIGNVGYSIGGNVATLKNRVTRISDDPNAVWSHSETWRGILRPYNSTVGQPYYSYWLIETDGIFQSDAEAQAYTGGSNNQIIQPDAKAGDLKFVDKNNDGVINDDDRVYMGNAFPKLTYGITGSLNYKNFDLSLFFQGVSGNKLFNAFKQSTLNAAEQGYNRWDKILEAWTPENTGSDIPRASVKDANKNFSTASDWFLEKGSYLRLKNAMLGYTFNRLPKNIKLRVFVTGDNLLTFTKYEGMDPEVGGVGFDGGQYPVSRSYAVGVNVTF